MTRTPPGLDTRTPIEPRRQMPAARQVLEAVGVPVGARETRVYASRNGWPNLGDGVPVVRMETYFSFDGGATWVFGGASEHSGGIAKDLSGKPQTESVIGIPDVPDDLNPLRQVRIEIIPVVPLNIGLDLECRSRSTIPNVGINARLG